MTVYPESDIHIAPTAIFHFVSLSDISLGIHVCLYPFHIEMHVPFGFFRVGWQRKVKSWNEPVFGITTSGRLWWC